LAIADLAGSAWPDRARAASLELSGARAPEDESAGVRLLADVHAIFEALTLDRISSAELADALHAIEESPWGEWYGKPITPRGIAKLLARFEIRPRTVRFDDETTPKGYKREQFEDAFARYLPEINATTPQPASVEGLTPFSIRHEPDLVADENPPISAWIDACGVVADEKAQNGDGADRDALQDELERLRRGRDEAAVRDHYAGLVDRDAITEREADGLVRLALALEGAKP
jgi:hypothetical protein